MASGNKKDNVTIIYTPWSNLKKDGSMAVGQVGFRDQRKVSLSGTSTVWLLSERTKVKKILVTERENPIVNRLNKTRVELFPDLHTEKENHLKALRKKDNATQRERVSTPKSIHIGDLLTCLDSKKKRPESRKSGRKRHGRETMRMMISTLKMRLRLRVIKTAGRTSKMTSCSSFSAMLERDRGLATCSKAAVANRGSLTQAHSHTFVQHPDQVIELVVG